MSTRDICSFLDQIDQANNAQNASTTAIHEIVIVRHLADYMTEQEINVYNDALARSNTQHDRIAHLVEYAKGAACPARSTFLPWLR